MSAIEYLNSWLNSKAQIFFLTSEVNTLRVQNGELRSIVAVLDYRVGVLEKSKPLILQESNSNKIPLTKNAKEE